MALISAFDLSKKFEEEAVKIFKFIFSPYYALFKTIRSITKAGRQARNSDFKWNRPDDWEGHAKASAFTSRLLWHIVFATPLWFAYGIYTERSFFFFWNSTWFMAIGVLMAMKHALIARQLRTNDLAQSRIQCAFRDGWWLPNA